MGGGGLFPGQGHGKGTGMGNKARLRKIGRQKGRCGADAL